MAAYTTHWIVTAILAITRLTKIASRCKRSDRRLCG
jgi:hypothetical protein